ncbi:CAAX protease self-immunity [Chryseobacterium arachidis]|uniref:CAAX protease self-immunity n=1 Tax=Chryseobacterium arachidis TaxID=1416778 RepID=A0A1M5A382_9FLAO|nr:CPBP family intramembrane glutamic endopeptidase [Chryseobacterium arachidis]SHF24312.1 CAAX protease self-immunity [Chryseobacterium arachidis]
MNYFLRLKNDTVDLLQFIKRPNDVQIKLSVKEKFLFIFNLLMIEIIFFLIFVFPLNYIAEKLITLKQSEAFENLGWYEAVFLFVIVAPVLEEWIFRYSLRYNSLFSKLVSREKWNKIFPFLVYILSSVFGLVHLDNYMNDSWKFYALSPLIVASQLSGGLILSFIRVRLNIFCSMLYHAIWNLLFGITIPCVMAFFINPYIDHGKNYNLHIEQKVFINKDEPVLIDVNSKDDTIYKVEAKQYQFQNLLNHIYGKDKHTTDEGLININFQSKEGISKQEFLEILQKEYMIK